ncbi:hypothetical protein Tco_1229334 [Tanacetum coccineum]
MRCGGDLLPILLLGLRFYLSELLGSTWKRSLDWIVCWRYAGDAQRQGLRVGWAGAAVNISSYCNVSGNLNKRDREFGNRMFRTGDRAQQRRTRISFWVSGIQRRHAFIEVLDKIRGIVLLLWPLPWISHGCQGFSGLPVIGRIFVKVTLILKHLSVCGRTYLISLPISYGDLLNWKKSLKEQSTRDVGGIGFIDLVFQTWGAPGFFVKKKDGGAMAAFVIDYANSTVFWFHSASLREQILL